MHLAAAVASFFAAATPSASPMPAGLILLLCVLAGIGTVLLLPSVRETSFRAIGGVLVLLAGIIAAALLLRARVGAAQDGVGVYFWIFSAIAIAAALRVITHPRPVYSALYFVLSVLASAGLFVLLWAEFMAAALVLIYAGAILVTYVFVIMLAAQSRSEDGQSVLAEYDSVSREPLAACVVGFMLMAVLLIVIFDRAHGLIAAQPLAAAATTEGPTQRLGHYLFENQLVNVELAGVILTLAMVGAIVLAHRRIKLGEELFEEAETARNGHPLPTADNPHDIPVYGTRNPRQKSYPET